MRHVFLFLSSICRLASASASFPYSFTATLIHKNKNTISVSSDDRNSPIHIIDNIPHILLNSSDFSLFNFTARLNLTETAPDAIFDPHGFGRLASCGGSRLSCQFTNDFPAMQFTFAAYGNFSVYLGAHDPEASIKRIQGSARALEISGALPVERIPKNRLYPILHFPIVTEKIPGDYFDAAMLYRSFIFSAEPAWLSDPLQDSPLDRVQLWVNTHWQEYDVFAKAGGRPASVLRGTQQLLDLLGDAISPDEMALHWYEWDTLGFPIDGDYEGNCDNDVRCGFDSHYPQYFPPRRNFKQVAEELAELGIKIFPYINGRIFDTNIAHWNSEARQAAAKLPHAELYIENYGNGVDFAAMCPDTQYWQETLVQVTSEVFQGASVAGIYVDQVACAAPVPCYDEKHDHPPGGGDFWTRGYRNMLAQMHESSPGKLFVTESNVEQFIGAFDGFLTLQAFWDDREDSRIVPVFQAIYGGYIRTFGSIFHAVDLQSPAFREKLALQFIFGAQLGWFALAGADNNAGFPPVGMLEDLLLPENKMNVSFLKTLVGERRTYTRLLSRGTAGRRTDKFGQKWNLAGVEYLVAVNPYVGEMLIGGELLQGLSVLVKEVPAKKNFPTILFTA